MAPSPNSPYPCGQISQKSRATLCYSSSVGTRVEVQKWLDAGELTSVSELAKSLGKHPQYIYKVVKALRDKPKQQGDDATEAMLEACRSGSISDESANRILGKIMADGRDADRIKAIDIHDARNRASSSKIGPPPPQTPTQKIERLALMFQAAEPDELMEAARQSGYQMVPNQPAPQAPATPPVEGPLDQADLASS